MAREDGPAGVRPLTKLEIPTITTQPPTPIEPGAGKTFSASQPTSLAVSPEEREDEEDGSVTPTVKRKTPLPSAGVSRDTTPIADRTKSDGALINAKIAEPLPERPTSSALATDTESDGYVSAAPGAQSSLASEAGSRAGRLSVFSRRAASKSASDGERRTMTIETETVANVAHASTSKLDPTARSIRSKASTDTVRAAARPKKKRSRLPVASIGHAPTKSEIYAATITQAVDENEDSDSDETYVYESNPRSPKRLSRSPSLNSMASSSNQAGGTSVHHANDRRSFSARYDARSTYDMERERVPDKGYRGHHAISGKRSMKFAHNVYDDDDHSRRPCNLSHRASLKEDSPYRSPRVRGVHDRRGSPSQHHSSNNASHSNSATGSPRPHTSRSNSQNWSANVSGHGFKRSSKAQQKPSTFGSWARYDDDDGEGYSSREWHERSPMLRRKVSRYDGSGEYGEPGLRRRKRQHSTIWSGVPFIMAIVCLMVVVLFAGAAILSTTQPLCDVIVKNITNVLVSKQELSLDLVVEAYNPNAVAVNVRECEISIFAQSPYIKKPKPADDAKSSALGRLLGSSGGGYWPPWGDGDGDGDKERKGGKGKDGNDSDDDDDDEAGDSSTLLLGRVFKFDSILTFDSRFFDRTLTTASGELRVADPGKGHAPPDVLLETHQSASHAISPGSSLVGADARSGNGSDKGTQTPPSGDGSRDRDRDRDRERDPADDVDDDDDAPDSDGKEGQRSWERVIAHPFCLIVRGVIKYGGAYSDDPLSGTGSGSGAGGGEGAGGGGWGFLNRQQRTVEVYASVRVDPAKTSFRSLSLELLSA